MVRKQRHKKKSALTLNDALIISIFLLVVAIAIATYQDVIFPGEVYFGSGVTGTGGSGSGSSFICPSAVAVIALLAWDPVTTDVDGNPATLTGYRLYYRTAETTYTKDVSDVIPPTQTSWAVTKWLMPYKTNYIVATAFNDAGESDFSNEISYFYAPKIQIGCRDASGDRYFVVEYMIGVNDGDPETPDTKYTLQQSEDLKNWVAAGGTVISEEIWEGGVKITKKFNFAPIKQMYFRVWVETPTINIPSIPSP